MRVIVITITVLPLQSISLLAKKQVTGHTLPQTVCFYITVEGTPLLLFLAYL